MSPENTSSQDMPELAPRGMAKELAAVPALPRIERTFTSAPRISLVAQTSSGEPPSSRRIEGIFDGLACVEPHCFAAAIWMALRPYGALFISEGAPGDRWPWAVCADRISGF